MEAAVNARTDKENVGARGEAPVSNLGAISVSNDRASVGYVEDEHFRV